MYYHWLVWQYTTTEEDVFKFTKEELFLKILYHQLAALNKTKRYKE